MIVTCQEEFKVWTNVRFTPWKKKKKKRSGKFDFLPNVQNVWIWLNIDIQLQTFSPKPQISWCQHQAEFVSRFSNSLMSKLQSLRTYSGWNSCITSTRLIQSLEHVGLFMWSCFALPVFAPVSSINQRTASYKVTLWLWPGLDVYTALHLPWSSFIKPLPVLLKESHLQ